MVEQRFIELLKKKIQVVNALLEYGSDVSIISENNHTPLEYAMLGVRSFHNTLYNQLNSYDSDGDYYDPDRGICACEEIVELLKQDITKIEAKDECEAEIEIMKGEKINNNNVSFYILTQSIS